MFCGKCGKALRDEDKFCGECGALIRNIKPSVQESPNEPVAPVAPIAPAAPVAPIAPVAPAAPVAPIAPTASAARPFAGILKPASERGQEPATTQSFAAEMSSQKATAEPEAPSAMPVDESAAYPNETEEEADQRMFTWSSDLASDNVFVAEEDVKPEEPIYAESQGVPYVAGKNNEIENGAPFAGIAANPPQQDMRRESAAPIKEKQYFGKGAMIFCFIAILILSIACGVLLGLYLNVTNSAGMAQQTTYSSAVSSEVNGADNG